MNLKNETLQFLRNLIMYCATLLAFTQCGTPVEINKYIPQNAVWVSSIRPKVLIDHAKKNQKELFETTQKYFWGNAKENQKQYWLNNITKAGINFAETAYIFEVIPPEKNEQYTGFTCKLESESNFDAFMRNMPERNFSINSFAGLHYIDFDNKTILAWFNKTILAVRYEVPTDEHTITIRLVKLRDLAKNKSLKNTDIQFKNFLALNTEVNFWAKGEVLSRFVDFKDFAQPFHKEDVFVAQISLDENNAYMMANFSREQKFKGNDFLGFRRFFPANFVEKMTEKSITNKGFTFSAHTHIDTLRNMDFVRFLKENPKYKKNVSIKLPTEKVTMQGQFLPKNTKVSLILEKETEKDNLFFDWLKILNETLK